MQLGRGATSRSAAHVELAPDGAFAPGSLVEIRVICAVEQEIVGNLGGALDEVVADRHGRLGHELCKARVARRSQDSLADARAHSRFDGSDVPAFGEGLVEIAGLEYGLPAQIPIAARQMAKSSIGCLEREDCAEMPFKLRFMQQVSGISDAIELAEQRRGIGLVFHARGQLHRRARWAIQLAQFIDIQKDVGALLIEAIATGLLLPGWRQSALDQHAAVGVGLASVVAPEGFDKLHLDEAQSAARYFIFIAGELYLATHRYLGAAEAGHHGCRREGSERLDAP